MTEVEISELCHKFVYYDHDLVLFPQPSVDLMVSLEQATYVVLENASSLEVCVIIINGPDIVPQMEMNVTVFATNFNGSDKGM